MNGGDNSSDTHKLRAICCKLQVLSGEFRFSLDNKETWTNNIIWGQRKILNFDAFFSFLLQPVLHEFNIRLPNPHIHRNVSRWTIYRTFQISPFKM